MCNLIFLSRVSPLFLCSPLLHVYFCFCRSRSCNLRIGRKYYPCMMIVHASENIMYIKT
jgi:hypothetical protein